MLSGLDARRLVFVDEAGTNTSLASLYAYSLKEDRVYANVPRNRGANITLLWSMSIEGTGPSLAVEGATDHELIEAYVRHALASAFRLGQVMVMDNLTAHKQGGSRR